MIKIRRLRSVFFIIPGFISFGIGIAALVLPVLPGLPFFLIASYCFARSSKRVEDWFKRTKAYEKIVVTFREKKGLTLKEKIRINIIADACIVYSIFIVDLFWVRVMMVGLALYKHYYFFIKMKTIRRPKNIKHI